MADQPPQRFIPLQGPLNFRDLGGYPTRSGATVEWRRVFRSDAIHLMTPGDADHVYRTLGVATVLDLRTQEEVQRYGVEDVDGFAATYQHLPFLEDRQAIPGVDQDPVSRLTEMYLGILRNAGGQIAKGLETLSHADTLPAVFHCTAGKDRAGILAAIFLGVLDVDDEEILKDYSVTNQTIDRIIRRLRVLPGNEHMLERPVEYFRAQPRAMESMLKELANGHGGPEGYLLSHGLSSEAIDRLRASLLH